MKHILIITSFYASPRIQGLCKHLINFDWKVTVLTPPRGKTPRELSDVSCQHVRIIEIVYKDLIAFWKQLGGIKLDESVLSQVEKKFASTRPMRREALLRQLYLWGGSILAYPDEVRHWRIPAIQAGRKLLAEEKFDAILSSSFPVTSHRIAKTLAKENNIPWVADLRDLWTQNHNYLYPWRKFFESSLEKRTLRSASLFSTVSDSLAKKLLKRYPDKNVHVIQNGFDLDIINDSPKPLTKEFTITYTGYVYQRKQKPERLFEALSELIAEEVIDRSKILIRFYGVTPKWITYLANKFGLQDIVKQYGSVGSSEAVARQRDSQVLLMYGWEDSYETGVLPLKMFEYFAARRPILATGGTISEQSRQLLDKTQAGRHAISVNEIKAILTEYYQSYCQHGAVSYSGIPEEMDKYNHLEMAKKFAATLHSII